MVSHVLCACSPTAAAGAAIARSPSPQPAPSQTLTLAQAQPPLSAPVAVSVPAALPSAVLSTPVSATATDREREKDRPAHTPLVQRDADGHIDFLTPQPPTTSQTTTTQQQQTGFGGFSVSDLSSLAHAASVPATATQTTTHTQMTAHTAAPVDVAHTTPTLAERPTASLSVYGASSHTLSPTPTRHVSVSAAIPIPIPQPQSPSGQFSPPVMRFGTPSSTPGRAAPIKMLGSASASANPAHATMATSPTAQSHVPVPSFGLHPQQFAQTHTQLGAQMGFGVSVGVRAPAPQYARRDIDLSTVDDD